MNESTDAICFGVNQPISNGDLNALFAAAWGTSAAQGEPHDFGPMLERSLAYTSAYSSGRLVGFVNLAWDGGVHAFISEAVVHPGFQRRGIGSRLVRDAIEAARQKNLEWVHVDYEPHLQSFYEGCGFRPTTAGLVKLR